MRRAIILTLIAILSCGVVYSAPYLSHPITPVITSHNSAASVSVDENTTLVATLTYTPLDATLSVSGADSSLFTVNSIPDDGRLNFATAPDYETPGDAGANNVYNVTVTATANGRTDTTDFTITVVDVDEGTPGGDVTAPTLSSATINAAGTTLTVVWSENVTGSSGLSITPSGSLASLTYASGSGTSTYTYTISRPILDEETVTISASSSNIVDGATNTLANFSGTSVTNNSTQTAGTGESLRPAIFPSIPSEPGAAGFTQNDLSASVKTDVTPTTRSDVVSIAGGNYSTGYTGSTANRTYRLTGNVTYETVGIRINANNATVDLNGYTVTYKTVGPASVATATVATASDPSFPSITQTGLTLSSNSHYTFVVEFTSGAEAGNHYEVRDNNTTTLTLENHSGGSSDAWQDGGPSPGDTFRIYDSRLTYGVSINGTGGEVVNGYIVEGDGYGRGSSIRSGQGCNPIYNGASTIGGVKVTWHADNSAGIYCGASSVVKYCEIDDQGTLVTNRQRTIGAITPGIGSTIQHCRIINHRHAGVDCDDNTTVEYCEIFGDSRATNAYAIGTYADAGCIWRYNNIYKVGEHPICIALHSGNAQGADIHNNWCEAKSTRSSAEYGWNYATAFSNRWGTRTVANSIHDNTFITYSEDGPGANEESRGKTMFFGSLEFSVGEVVEDCFIGAYNTDDATECHAIGLSLHDKDTVFRGNTIVSSHNVFWIGDNYGNGTVGGRFIDNTIAKSGSDSAFKTFMTNGYYQTDADFISNTYGAGTGNASTDIGQDGLGFAAIDSGNIFRFGFNLTVTVTQSGSPVSGATVTVKDASLNTIRSSYTTNGSGVVVVDVPTFYRQGAAFSNTSITPLTVSAVSGAASGSNTISPTGDDTITVTISE